MMRKAGREGRPARPPLPGMGLPCRAKGRHSRIDGPEALCRYGRLAQGFSRVPH